MSFFNAEHQRFLKALIEHKVKFLIVGGQAATFYGVERNTGDLDILVEPTVSSGKKVIKTCKELSLELPDLKPEEFTNELVLTFGNQPEAVDIINKIPGFEFDAVYNNAQSATLLDMEVKFIDIADLIKSKEALNRKDEKAYLDKYDIAVLKKIMKGSG